MATEAHPNDYECFGCRTPESQVDGKLEPVEGADGRSPRLHCSGCRLKIEREDVTSDGLRPGWNA